MGKLEHIAEIQDLQSLYNQQVLHIYGLFHEYKDLINILKK